eukprot:scaffold75_cov165-Amphora_coffeaeformis.AAC.25
MDSMTVSYMLAITTSVVCLVSYSSNTSWALGMGSSAGATNGRDEPELYTQLEMAIDKFCDRYYCVVPAPPYLSMWRRRKKLLNVRLGPGPP